MREVPRYDMETDATGSLFTRVAPPPVEPHAPVVPEPEESLVGRRVILVAPLVWYEDVRVVSEPIRTPEGAWVVQVCDEVAWYAAGQDAGAVPAGAIKVWPVSMAFLD